MMKSALTMMGVAMSLAAMGCAPATTTTMVMTSKATPPPEPAPIAVSYELQGAAAKTIVSGTMNVSSRWTSFKSEAVHAEAMEDFQLRAEPRKDGTYLVEVFYAEKNGDGTTLKWGPSLLAKHGEKTSAQVAWAGGARSISLTVQ